MKNWNLELTVLFLTLLSSFPILGQGPDTKSDIGANAALKYWTALSLLPNLDKSQEKLLEEWNQIPLDAAAVKLIERSRNSLTYLHRGAKIQRCDWSLNYEDGSFLALPYLAKTRNLARFAALHARYEFEQGHLKSGWDDVTALFKMARHLELEPLAIQQMVGYAIETIAFKAVAPYLTELKSSLSEAEFAVLDTLPLGATLQQMVLKEKQISAMWLIGALKETERSKEGSWLVLWREIFGAPEEGEASRDLAKAVTTFDQAIKMLEDIVPLFDELAKLTSLPWKEFDAQYPEFVKKAKVAYQRPVFILSMGAAMATERRNQTERALFKAALAVVQEGPGKLKDIKDPNGDGPFEYRTLDKGFELKSKLLYQDKPVTLIVGQRSK